MKNDARMILAAMTAGVFPSLATYNPSNHYVYVDARGAPGPGQNSSILVISDTKIIGNISVGNDADAVAYDPANHNIYVGSYGTNEAAAISGTGIIATVKVGGGPTAMAFDPANNYMYVTAGSVGPALSRSYPADRPLRYGGGQLRLT
jgi:DNA-binding beta-propeller fold protein YncE